MDSELHAKTEKIIKHIVFPFYDLRRDMVLPTRELNENDAEHSWSLALVACTLAPQIDTTLDICKVAQFATVHDLVEVYSGDVSVYDRDANLHEDKEASEAKAMDQLRKEFAHLPWIIETLEDYETKSSPEARYVWAMDKYVAMYMRYLYAAPFFHSKGISKAFFDESMVRVKRKVNNCPPVAKLFNELLEEFDKHLEWFVNK